MRKYNSSINKLFIVHCLSKLFSSNVANTVKGTLCVPEVTQIEANTVKGTLCVPEVTQIDLLNIIHSMKIKKSTGLYSVSSFHLRECAS
jgi:hypothetical protein